MSEAVRRAGGKARCACAFFHDAGQRAKPIRATLARESPGCTIAYASVAVLLTLCGSISA